LIVGFLGLEILTITLNGFYGRCGFQGGTGFYGRRGSAAGAGSVGGTGSTAGAGALAGLAVLGGLALAAPPETGRVVILAGVSIVLAICVAFTIVFGVDPSPLIHFARHATLSF
jgi:hypothetical protein